MRVVVTGAAGFIGAVFCRRAAEEGHDVFALDDRSRGLNPVWDLSDVTFIEHDCRDGLTKATLPIPIDVVVHLAAGTGSLHRPIDELRDLNVKMTQRVFHDALSLGTKVLVFPTTSLAVGVPDSPYVISKEEGLTWLRENVPDRELMRLLLLRLFNVAGAYKGFTERRKNEVHMIPTMAQAFLDGTRFVINGNDYSDNGLDDSEDRSPARDYVHVVDVVDYVMSLVRKRVHGEPIVVEDDQAVWVGTGRPTTVRQAVQIFRQWVGSLDTEYGPRRPFDAGFLRCRTASIEQFAAFRPPAPSWVAIRDEARELVRQGLPDERG